MREVKGDLWAFPADARCITTNGCIKKNGECVMGRGCASEAKAKFPGLAKALGFCIQNTGNHVYCFDKYPKIGHLFSFPVKHNWYEQADPKLIVRSAGELVSLVDARFPDYTTILIPRPGCGNGGLDWNNVKPLLEPILDDRFIIISFLEE